MSRENLTVVTHNISYHTLGICGNIRSCFAGSFVFFSDWLYKKLEPLCIKQKFNLISIFSDPLINYGGVLDMDMKSLTDSDLDSQVKR